MDLKCPKSHSLKFHSFNKYFSVCVNYVSGTVLSNETTMVNKRVITPTLMELAFS